MYTINCVSLSVLVCMSVLPTRLCQVSQLKKDVHLHGCHLPELLSRYNELLYK